MKLLTALTVVMMTSAAFADGGALTSPSALPADVKTKLSEEIAAAKKANPGPFSSVASIKAGMAKLDAQKRGRIAPVSLTLKPLGPSALYPLIEQVAFDSPRGDLNDSAWLGWQVGVVEALGIIRDDRALPVLEASLRTNTRPELVRASAEAVGRLGTESAAKILISLASDSVRGPSVRSAMGNCRRLIVAQALASYAETTTDARDAVSVAKALGDVGNAWAWETPAVKAVAAGEEGAVRQVAADALVRLFVRFDGQARQAASNALLVVNAPTTPQTIEAASRDAKPETKVALVELSKRFAHNPVK